MGSASEREWKLHATHIVDNVGAGFAIQDA